MINDKSGKDRFQPKILEVSGMLSDGLLQAV